jgi:hypothetical protein
MNETTGPHEPATPDPNPVPAREYEPGYDSEADLQGWMNELRAARAAANAALAAAGDPVTGTETLYQAHRDAIAAEGARFDENWR